MNDLLHELKEEEIDEVSGGGVVGAIVSAIGEFVGALIAHGGDAFFVNE